ncbi:MAG: TetR/AcrR family transcriptional regulator [Pseudoclavibacter sp.]
MSTPSQRTDRSLRADAERSIGRILAAADDVFTRNPSATLEEVAKAAGVARATVHRRFTSREALRDALARQLDDKLRQALDAADVRTAPPLVALYQLTVTTLELKTDWRASWQVVDQGDGLAPEVIEELDHLLRRACDVGLLKGTVDPLWTRGVYMALVHEAAVARPDGAPAPEWAHRILCTLVMGLGHSDAPLEDLLHLSI